MISLIFALLVSTTAALNPGRHDTSVVDPEKCRLQWEIRLEQPRNMNESSEGWPEQFILDANLGGDFKMAQKYMRNYGWFAAATEKSDDLTLYFMPDTTPASQSRFGEKRVQADPKDGIKLACHAAWVSGVPFVKVVKRGEGGQGVLYEVSTDYLPVKDF